MNSTFEQIKKLFSNETVWAKEWYAFNNHGQPTHPSDPGACCFCLLGAITKISDNGPSRERYKIAIYKSIKDLAKKSELPFPHYKSIPEFNDDPKTTIEHVRLVIENAENFLVL